MSLQKENAFLSFFQPGANLREAALAYASVGMFVLPLQPGGKVPITKHGWHNASTNAEQIKKWWSQEDNYNIGIALQPSCIVVIDIDPRNDGKETWEEAIHKFGSPPETYTVRTANQGVHYYYRVPVDFYESAAYPGTLGPGVDLLINKLVVAPPSQLGDQKQYVIASGSLEEEFTLLPFRWLERIFVDERTRKDSLWAPTDDSWVVPYGQHDDTLTAIAGVLRRKGANEREIAHCLRAFIPRFENAGPDLAKEMIPRVAKSIGTRPPDLIRFKDLTLVRRPKQRKPELKPEALFGPIGEFVKFIEPMTEAHPAALLGQSLAVFGNIIGAKTKDSFAPGFIVEDSYHRTALYINVVGDSAQAGKGDSWSRVRKLFQNVDPTWRTRTGIQTGEGLIEALADDEETGEVTVIQGQKVKHVKKGGQTDKRYCIFEPEFGRVLHTANRVGSTIKDIYRPLWDEGETEKVTASSQQRVTGATVTVVGHITRPELERDFDQIDLVNGFGNRFLYVYVERTKTLASAPSLSPMDLETLTEPLHEALIFAQDEAPEDYPFSYDAGEMWEDLCQGFHKGSHSSEVVSSLVARARPFVRRLAVIYAVSDCSTVIEVEHLEAANAFWDYCAESIQFIFGNRIGDKNADKLYRALLEYAPGLTITEIQHQVFSNNASRPQLERSIFLLKEGGLLFERKEKRGRKTTTIYYVHPIAYD